MPTTIYDSSLITKRNKDRTESGSFVTRISPWNNISASNQPVTSYGPALGIWDQSIVNSVKNGTMAFYRKNEGGCTTINNGCPCSNST